MSRFANFIKGITSPFVSDSAPTESEKRARVRRRRRERYNSPDKANTAKRGKTRKDEGEDGPINRLVTVNEDVRDSIRGNARSKPYDPVFLRDISANAVVQAYIDTLSQDVSSTEWAIKPRDEDADISDEALAKVERHIKELPPGNQTFADLLEATTRVLLELGDAAIVKHYYENSPGRVAELVPVDSASIFKLVDKHGIPEGYVQISKRGGKKVDEFDVDDVVWAEWSNRPDRFYGQGPLEKAQNEVELIEELAEKERLDLIQGGPPGVVSPEALDEYGGLPNDEDWETFVEEMRLDQGERHRVGYSKTPVNFEPINHNYQELQILDRSKYWVTVIGSVFKVNPSYAGFDFENVNRATDESQRESFKQRGFRVTLRQLEEALNRGFVWNDISEDVKFEFTKEQTIEERRDRASLIEDQAAAGKEMANAGRDVSLRDGRLVVEDGELEEGDAGGGGGGGGLFGSVDDPGDADVSIEARKDDDGVRLHYPMGGVAHSSQDQYRAFLNDVAEAGGRIIDTAGFDNGNERVWPPDEPDPHDPRMVVYGLDETGVLALLDRYPDVHLQINTDHDHNAKSDSGNVNKAEVPDNAQSYSDPSEVPEGARTITGPQGGDYYIPPGQEAVGDRIDLSNADPKQPDIDAETSVNADNIALFELEDGSEAYGKQLDNFWLSDGEDVVAAADVMDMLGGGVPTHDYKPDEDMVVTEAVDGDLLAESDPDDVDRESFNTTMASALAVGHGDINAGNFIVEDDGTVSSFDNDIVGKPWLTGGIEDGELTDTAASFAEDVARDIGLEFNKDELQDTLKQMAESADLESIEDRVSGSEDGDQIVANIEAARGLE